MASLDFIFTDYIKIKFWSFYEHLPFNEKKYYEIIRKCCPVKLNLDIEFDKTFNRTIDGKKTTD